MDTSRARGDRKPAGSIVASTVPQKLRGIVMFIPAAGSGLPVGIGGACGITIF